MPDPTPSLCCTHGDRIDRLEAKLDEVLKLLKPKFDPSDVIAELVVGSEPRYNEDGRPVWD